MRQLSYFDFRYLLNDVWHWLWWKIQKYSLTSSFFCPLHLLGMAEFFSIASGKVYIGIKFCLWQFSQSLIFAYRYKSFNDNSEIIATLYLIPLIKLLWARLFKIQKNVYLVFYCYPLIGHTSCRVFHRRYASIFYSKCIHDICLCAVNFCYFIRRQLVEHNKSHPSSSMFT